MRVFKFGGASVKDAAAVQNAASIIAAYGEKPLVVVISAMGKTTNALEDVLGRWWRHENYLDKISEIADYHEQILGTLIPDRNHEAWQILWGFINELKEILAKSQRTQYDFVYDQTVCYGELISTAIVSAYLNETGLANFWADAREYIKTDSLYREARVNWEATINRIKENMPGLTKEKVVITQGFIGSSDEHTTTTLGREGSDYTAAVFAFALDARELVIWKDVAGIMNADPKKFPQAAKYDTLSYHEAVEMTYYGASVLHPKTIKPLQNKNIPLQVRSFVHPEAQGTIVSADYPVQKDIPIIISKEKQVLVSLSTKDYSFIAEENIELIFDEVVRYGIKVNVMHNSAISFQVCIDDRGPSLEDFIRALDTEFVILKKHDLELVTVKYYSDDMLKGLINGRKVWLEQLSGETVQYVLDKKENN